MGKLATGVAWARGLAEADGLGVRVAVSGSVGGAVGVDVGPIVCVGWAVGEGVAVGEGNGVAVKVGSGVDVSAGNGWACTEAGLGVRAAATSGDAAGSGRSAGAHAHSRQAHRINARPAGHRPMAARIRLSDRPPAAGPKRFPRADMMRLPPQKLISATL